MGRVFVLSLGWTADELRLGAARRLKEAARVVLRTSRLGCAQWLREQGVPCETLDALHRESEDFDALADEAARRVLALADTGDVAYGVAAPSDRSVARLIALAPDRLAFPEGDFLAALAGTRHVSVAACDFDAFTPNPRLPTLISELDSRLLASEMKLRLMEAYPDGFEVTVSGASGDVSRVKLCELDRMEAYSHRVCALVPALSSLTALERYDFEHLNEIMRVLRGENGCPWDKKQTHESLKPNLLEEAYEAADAIERGDTDDLYDELGDVLLQVALHAEIGRQHGEFDVSDITTAICRKMISRHPHIFADARAETAEDVLTLWQRVKKEERKLDSQADVLRGVTRSLPALMRACKVQKRAADVGFDWRDAREALAALRAETDELERAMDGDGSVENELGDVLFSAANAARMLRVDPEIALSASTDRFIRRFSRMEERIRAEGSAFEKLSPAAMNDYWTRAKRELDDR